MTRIPVVPARALLAAVAALTFAPTRVGALAIQPVVVQEPPLLNLDSDDSVGPEIPIPPCEGRLAAVGLPSVVGIPIAGLTVTIRGGHIKLVNSDPWCNSYMRPLADGEWTWEITDSPGNSAATLSRTDTLNPEFTPDLEGEYEVTLHTCPSGCPFEGTSVVVPPGDRTIRFHTNDRLPPERHPAMPPSRKVPATCDPDTNTCTESSLPCQSLHECTVGGQPLFDADLKDIKCLGGGGVKDPQWVTVQEFAGVEHYAGYHGGIVYALEGFVGDSKISPMDNEFNHHSQDANFNVLPDPIHRHFKTGEGVHIHNEWETNTLAGSFQPSRTDRISMWGYLIHDCGHFPYNTEIHPPVGLAVHRERAIPIPDDWTSPLLPNPLGNPSSVGLGVYVPGVLTDVWFNRDAGEMIEGDWTALHQPAYFQPADCDPDRALNCQVRDGQTGYVVGGRAIDFLADLNAIFEFRIFLPPSPKAVLEAAGITGLPEVPLYYEIIPGNIGEERVSITVVTEEAGTAPDVTYLDVKVDLTEALPSDTPWFRVAAAWVYPDRENWGLRRFRLTLPALYVTDDGDGVFRGKGEWSLWLQTNSARLEAPLVSDGLPRQEWTKIVRQDVEGGACEYFPGSEGVPCGRRFDFGGRPWATGNSDGSRYLGPDPLLYPGQPLQLHLSGYEEDWFGGDSLGRIEKLLVRVGEGQAANVCSTSFIADVSPSDYGCADYTATWSMEDLGAVPQAQLSSAAWNLVDAYRLSSTDHCDDDVGCQPGPILAAGALPLPVRLPELHPEEEELEPGGPAVAWRDTELFEPAEVEENVLNHMNIFDLQGQLRAMLEQDPQKADAYFTRLRGTFDQAWRELGDEVLLDLRAFEMAMPAEEFEKYFGDVPEPQPAEDATRRFMKGAGKLGSGADKTHINVDLKCDPLRPQKLRVEWKPRRRFDLDVLTVVACDQDPAPMRTFSGVGYGTLDGRAGYLARWTMVDEGPGGDTDSLRIQILAHDGSVVHDVGGPLDGNLRGLAPDVKAQRR